MGLDMKLTIEDVRKVLHEMAFAPTEDAAAEIWDGLIEGMRQDGSHPSERLTYKGYTARISCDDEDEIFIGRVADIRDGITWHGETFKEFRQAFYDAVDSYLECCKEWGDEPNTPEVMA